MSWLTVSILSCSELKGSPCIFYSRGYINVKGLGDRQTFFVEPPDSKMNPTQMLARNESVITLPVAEAADTQKEEASRNASFVTYSKCTMVTTPSVQFVHTAPSNPSFETDVDDSSQSRPDRTSSEGLVMRRPAPSSENTPMSTPRSSSVDSPDTQIRRNKVAPNKVASKTELKPMIEEVAESEETSGNSTASASVIDAFISKNSGTAGVNGGAPAPVAATTVAIEEQNRQENSTANQSTNGGSENRRAKKAKCVIS